MTNYVIAGFEAVLHNQAVLFKDVGSLNELIVYTIKDDNARQAIQSYLQYITSQRSIADLAQRCASTLTLKIVNDAECIDNFGLVLSTVPFSGVPLKNGVPMVLDPTWTNRALSLGVGFGTNQLPQFYFSLPLYFANYAPAFLSMTTWNQEAVASSALLLLNTSHPQTLANPEILRPELQTLIEAVRLRPDIKKQPYAGQLFSQAVAGATIANANFMDELWQMLQANLKAYDEGVSTILQQFLDRPDAELVDGQNFLGNSIPFCDPRDKTTLPLTTPTAGGNIDIYVPEIFWQAQHLGLGKVGKCFEWSTADANGSYQQVRYSIRLFWNPAGPVGNVYQTVSSAPAAMDGSSQTILKRHVDSIRHYSTYSDSWATMAQRAWLGMAGSEYLVQECSPHPDLKCFDPSRPIARDMFMQSSVQDTDGGDVEHAKAEITKRVVDNLSDYLHSATNAWDPQTLANENYKGVTPLNYPSPSANTDLSVLMSAYASRYLMAGPHPVSTGQVA